MPSTDDRIVIEASGGETDVTINRMELFAMKCALNHIFRADIENSLIRIISDSSYAIGSLSEWADKHRLSRWKNRLGEEIANARLIRTTLSIIADIKLSKNEVVFVKIKGHSGHHYNEQADRLAGTERSRLLEV
jgi:ribonuclease HI